MANGIVIHVAAGEEKRTEFFDGERIRVGTEATSDLQLEPPEDHVLASQAAGLWLELRRENGSYRVANFKEDLDFQLNNAPLELFTKLREGDLINIPIAEKSNIHQHKRAPKPPCPFPATQKTMSENDCDCNSKQRPADKITTICKKLTVKTDERRRFGEKRKTAA